MNFRTRTPKGDGNNMSVRREQACCMVFQNTNPERGRKLFSTIFFSYHLSKISEHEPRKGTETFLQFLSIGLAAGDISEHEPRKGTETEIGSNERCTASNISEHEPRKGTETFPASDISVWDGISEHEPRKGTETPLDSYYCSSFQVQFQNTNPERGRKRFLVSTRECYVVF